MYKVVRKQTRPNKNVPFYGLNSSSKLSAETIALRENRYVQTGKIASVQREMSEDQLSLTTTVIFESKAALAEYQTDPDLASLRQEQMEYFANNGITFEVVSRSEEI